MIWLLGAIVVLLVAVFVFLIFVVLWSRQCFNDIQNEFDHIREIFKFPECNFDPDKQPPCLYSPGSERDKICAIREQEAKDKDEKTYIREAPKWRD